MLWDFGSAARHHQLYSPWLAPENCRAGMLGLRGAIAPSAGLMDSAVREIKGMLADAGLADEPVGVDIVEPPFLFEMQRQGLTVVDAQQLMLDAREIKSADEIMLLTQAAAMVDGVYQDIVEVLKPGRPGERDRRAGQQAALRDGLGPGRGDQRGLRRALQPAPAQLLRPHHPARGPGVLRHHPLLQRLPDLLLPHVQRRQRDRRRSATPTPRRASGWTPRSPRSSRASAPTRSPRLWPAATDFGFADEMAAFGLQFGHGLGLGLHERPIITRLNSLRATRSSCGRGWSSRWRPTARRPTGSPRRGSRRRSSSPTTARAC